MCIRDSDRLARIGERRKQWLGLAMPLVTGRQQRRRVVQMRVGERDDLVRGHAA